VSRAAAESAPSPPSSPATISTLVIRSVALLALLAVGLAGCFGNSEPTAAEKTPAQSSTTYIATRACPVTNANGESPPGEKPDESFYGNGKLWTVLWPEGKVLAGKQDMRPDGSIEIKFPWWAAGVEGGLSIAGRRLDGPAPLSGRKSTQAGRKRASAAMPFGPAGSSSRRRVVGGSPGGSGPPTSPS
jgi:hypothetical protein